MKIIKKFLPTIFIIFILSACAARSYNFVGVNLWESSRILRGVAQSAMVSVDEFIRDWLQLWEDGELQECYDRLGGQIQKVLPIETLEMIRNELDDNYGQTEEISILELPITKKFPSNAEGFSKKTTDTALKYYDYVFARYLNRRTIHNLIYYIGVAIENEELKIVCFGLGKEPIYPNEKFDFSYCFGYPIF